LAKPWQRLVWQRQQAAFLVAKGIADRPRAVLDPEAVRRARCRPLVGLAIEVGHVGKRPSCEECVADVADGALDSACSGAFALYASCSTAKMTSGGVAARVIGWVGLTAILWRSGFSYVFYYALWLAPTQAVALLSVGWCSRIQDKEHTARRLAAKSDRS
jgi:hypothetical protein